MSDPSNPDHEYFARSKEELRIIFIKDINIIG